MLIFQPQNIWNDKIIDVGILKVYKQEFNLKLVYNTETHRCTKQINGFQRGSGRRDELGVWG